MAQLQQLNYVSFLTWMLIAMSSLDITLDWDSFKSQASMLDRLDDLMQYATDAGRIDLADTLHRVYLELESHLRTAHRARLAVVK